MNNSRIFGRRVHTVMAAATGAMLLGSLAIVASSTGAGADTQRYQMQTMNITVALTTPAATSGNVHEYTVTLNPCDGTFAGTGGGFYGLSGSEYVTESVSGSYVAGSFTLNSTYNGTFWGNPYTYAAGPVSIPLNTETATTVNTWSSGSPAGTYSVWVTLSMSTSLYANHGQYVAASGGGSDAAHSCVGMPIQSQS